MLGLAVSVRALTRKTRTVTVTLTLPLTFAREADTSTDAVYLTLKAGSVIVAE